VADFLEGSRTLSKKPYLFCQSTWLEAKTMDDTWIDQYGLDEHKEDSNGFPLPELYKNREIQYMIDTLAQSPAGSIPVSTHSSSNYA
jgi:hypothetical protein